MIDIKLDKSLGDFQRYLEGIPKRVERNMLGAARQAGAYLRRAVQLQFESQRQPWAPLNAKYRAWKVSQGFDARTLMRSHILSHAINFRLSKFDGANASGEIYVPAGMSYPVMTSPGAYGLFKKTGKGDTFDSKSAKKVASVRRGKKSKRVSVEDVAAYHELGHGRKRRPFFAPTAKEEADRVIGYYVRAMKEALRR